MDQYDFQGKSYRIWINRKGYACITTNDQGCGKGFLLHKLVWEAANGPVPMGYEIHHLDHNRANWKIDNLMAVDRRTHEMHRQARPTEYSHKAGDKLKKA